MLEVHVNGSWVAASPAQLAQMLLNGVVEQTTPARDRKAYGTKGPLERLVEPTHCRELSRQLPEYLCSMYSARSTGNDVARLRAVAEGLCKWDWPDQLTRSRVTWVAAWLAEQTGGLERAVGHYSAFLQHRSPEVALKLLAYNNRGVLLIRLGRIEGLRDLARSAIPVELDPRLAPLPAACFNLLNLVTYAAETESLRSPVETALVNCMSKLPKDVREQWLGPDPKRERDDDDSPVEPLQILKDPTFRRLNKLTTLLAARAEDMAPGEMPKGGQLGEWVKSQLCLWTVRPEIDVCGYVSADTRGRQPQPALRPPHAEYAEAATLLFVSEIPTTLQPKSNSIDWAVQIARDSLAHSEDYMATEQYGLARSTLEAARQVLGSGQDGPRAKDLRRKVDSRLKVIERRVTERQQRGLYQVFVEITQEVERFCLLTELCQARRDSEALKQRLERLSNELQEIWGDEFVRTLDEHRERIDVRLGELERADLERKLEGCQERLLGQWPVDWLTPVPDAVYEALAECRLHDPHGRVKNWDSIKSQLDAHQAKYYFDRAIQSVSQPGFDRAQVEEGMATALSLNPDLGPAAAPLFGLLELPVASAMPAELTELRTELLNTSRRLLEDQPLGADGVWSSAVRADLIRQACSLLKRLFQAFQGVGDEFVAMWRSLEEGFKMALAESRPEVAVEIEQMIQACLDVCPVIAGGMAAPSDPRNPLRILLEKCHRAQLLGRGEVALNAKAPDRDAASDYFRQALEAGLDRDQLRRAAVGIYLASIGTQDAAELQRRTLDRLEAWANQLPPDTCAGVRETDVARRVNDIRQELAGAKSPVNAQDQPNAGPDAGGEVVE